MIVMNKERTTLRREGYLHQTVCKGFSLTLRFYLCSLILPHNRLIIHKNRTLKAIPIALLDLFFYRPEQLIFTHCNFSHEAYNKPESPLFMRLPGSLFTTRTRKIKFSSIQFCIGDLVLFDFIYFQLSYLYGLF